MFYIDTGIGVDALPALRAGSAFFGGSSALASAVIIINFSSLSHFSTSIINV